MKRAALLLLVLALLPAALPAQSVSTGISRDTVRVGDPVRVLLRIDGIPANTEVILPDSLSAVDDVENAGRLRMRRDTMTGGRTRITAAYPVILWRPGEIALPNVPMAGDHTLFIGEVLGGDYVDASKAPLVRLRGRYRPVL